MSYDLADAARDLAKVRDGEASPEERSEVELFLVKCLQDRGPELFDEMIRGLGDLGFIEDSDGSVEFVRRYVAPGPSPDVDLQVISYAYEDMFSISVHAEPPLSHPADQDPRHAAFYEVWENIPAEVTTVEVAGFDPGRRAVFLIALLEAQVMNGGFGQYLANTDGVYVEDTMQCLAEIQATTTRTLLGRALELRDGVEPWFELWDRASEALNDLDGEFYEAGEDLAGLTVDRFRELLPPEPPE